MEVWEDAGMTREEYEQAMAEMDEALGLSEPPTDEDMMGMHMQYVVDDILPKADTDGLTANDWAEIRDAIGEADEIQTMHPNDPANSYVQPLADFAHAHGFDPQSGTNVHEWAERQWQNALEAESPDIDEVPFDKMLDHRIARGEAWTQLDADAMNRKILQERDDIERTAYEEAMRSDAMHATADTIDYLRERDGINGDEPDIPWYEACDHAFGKSAEDIHVEADEVGEAAGHLYETGMRDLYRRIYEYDVRDFHDVPETVRGDMPMSSFHVARSTYDELGEDYSKFYCDRLQEYAAARKEEASVMRGVDLTRGTMESPAKAEPEKAKSEKARQTQVAKADERAKRAEAVSSKAQNAKTALEQEKPRGDIGEE